MAKNPSFIGALVPFLFVAAAFIIGIKSEIDLFVLYDLVETSSNKLNLSDSH